MNPINSFVDWSVIRNIYLLYSLLVSGFRDVTVAGWLTGSLGFKELTALSQNAVGDRP